jgi:hypothetical protein
LDYGRERKTFFGYFAFPALYASPGGALACFAEISKSISEVAIEPSLETYSAPLGREA